jgi:alkylation response protein AidB-like acyl-CoA dehydrogenase
MDFALTPDQIELANLTRRIATDKVTPELLQNVESGTDRFDGGLWKALAEAGILGISLPEDVSGGGLGLLEQCLVLEELGRRVAPVPVLASIVLGAAPIAEFGTPDQRKQWAAPAATGSKILTAALAEPANPDPKTPRTVAVPISGGYQLEGVKTSVPAGNLADLILVPASVEGTVVVFLVEPAEAGVKFERQRTSNRETTARFTLEGVTVTDSAVLGRLEDGPKIVDWLVDRATIGLCAHQLGVIEEALAETAEYTKTRSQFGRPIATFQAVGHRCADSYIATEGARLTLWQAVWRLDAGLPASTEVEVAKFWAAEAGHQVAHAAVHLHGGMGVANEHTTHRYFVAAKQNEFMLGGATHQLLKIGDALAAEAV